MPILPSGVSTCGLRGREPRAAAGSRSAGPPAAAARVRRAPWSGRAPRARAGTACARSEADQRSRSTSRTVTASAVAALPVTRRRTHVQRLGQRLVGDDLPVGDVAGLAPIPCPRPRRTGRRPRSSTPGERHPAADRAEQRAAQRARARRPGCAASSTAPALAERSRCMPRTDSAVTVCVASSSTRQANSERSVRASARLGELREHQPGERSASLRVAALGQFDTDPQRVVEGAQRELPAAAVVSKKPAKAGRSSRAIRSASSTPMSPARADCRSRASSSRSMRCAPVARPPARCAARRQRGRRAVQQFAQLGHGGEAPVDAPGRARAAGPARSRPGGCRRRAGGGEVADEGLGEHPGRLVGVVGAAVEVEVVGGVGVARPDHDVERVVGPEAGPGRGRRRRRRRCPASAWRHSDSTTGRTSRAVLPRPGRPDGEQRGAEQRGLQGDAGAAARVAGCAWSSTAVPIRTWRGEQVVAGGAARAGRARPEGWAQAAAPVPRTVSAKAASRVGPGVHATARRAGSGVVHVVHPAGARLGGEPVGGVARPRGPQLGPLGGVGLRRRRARPPGAARPRRPAVACDAAAASRT